MNKCLVLGKTGNGKSTLCNYILNYEEKKCKESELAQSCTTEICGHVSNQYKDIYMIDTPGLSDTNGRDQEIIDRIRKEIKEKHCQGIKSILLVQNLNDDRLSLEDQKIISIYSKMFPNPEFWYHVGIVFSKAYEYFPQKILEKHKKNKFNNYLKDFAQIKEKITSEMNKDLPKEKQIKIPGIINIFFTDCGEVDEGYTHDRTDKEFERLIRWTRTLDYIDFDKNDLNSRISCDYKSKIPIEDSVETKKEIVSDNETKIIDEHYKTYKVIDFNDKETKITEPNSYKTEIYFVKKEEFQKTKKILEEKDGIKKEKIETITYLREDIYDKNHKLIKKGKEIEKNKSLNENIKERKEYINRFKVNYQTDEFEFESETAAQKYIQELSEASIGAKVFIVVYSILNPVYGIINLVELIKSKVTKERLRVVTKYYRDERYAITITKDIFGKERRSKPELIKTENECMECTEVRID